MNKAFIFDMDGVLLDSELIYYNSLNSYIKDLGVRDNLSYDDFSTYTGMKLDEISRNLKKRYKINKDILEISNEQNYYYDIELGKIEKLESMLGLKEFLDYLRIKGYKIALASSSDKAWVDRVLDELEVRKYFDVIVDGLQVANSKPKPDIFLFAANQLNVDAEQCYIIEDSVNGIQAGKNAGMFVFGYKGSQIIQNTSFADAEVNSFEEIIRFMESKLCNK